MTEQTTPEEIPAEEIPAEEIPAEPTELEAAVSSLLITRGRIDEERSRARAEIGRQLDNADRFAWHQYVSALGLALDRIDVALVLLDDVAPLDPQAPPRDVAEAQLAPLLEDAEPGSASWRRVLVDYAQGRRELPIRERPRPGSA